MQVKHFLPAAFAGVDLCFEAVRQAVCRGDLRHFQHHFRHQSRITALKVRQLIEVFFRNKQLMHGCGRIDVFETQHIFIFIHHAGGNLLSGNFAENTIAHFILQRAAV